MVQLPDEGSDAQHYYPLFGHWRVAYHYRCHLLQSSERTANLLLQNSEKIDILDY